MERAAAFAPLLLLLAIPALSAWRLIRGLRSGPWKRPAWFAQAAWVALFFMAWVWLLGTFAGGLDARDACMFGGISEFDAHLPGEGASRGGGAAACH